MWLPPYATVFVMVDGLPVVESRAIVYVIVFPAAVSTIVLIFPFALRVTAND
jgi:hypothetical protein